MPTINLPYTLVDGQGFDWDIDRRGAIVDGTNDAFDTGMTLVGASSFSTAETEDSGREVILGAMIFGDVSVVRKIFVSPVDGFIRYLEVVTNNGASATDFDLHISTGLGSDSSTVATTSSNDTVFDTADTWIVTDDNGGTDPAVAQIVAGAGGTAPEGASRTGDTVDYTYGLSLAAGETKIVMHFASQAATVAGAEASAALLAGLGGSALSGISAEELGQIVNFHTSDATPLILTGTAGSDVLIGDVFGDTINGLGGDDTIQGGGGDDHLLGSGGNDFIQAGTGNDTVDGGTNDDVVFGGDGNDAINGGDGVDVLFGEDGNDTISGGTGNDIIQGGSGVDRLVGGAGNDVIDGGAGNDALYGDESNALETTYNETIIPSTGQNLAVSMTLPDSANGTTVDLSGFVSRSPVTSDSLNVALVIDVSSSMSSTFSGTLSVPDVNGDGFANTVLDATILAYENLLETIVNETAVGSVNVAVIPFSTTSTTNYVGLATSDANGNGTPDVIDSLRSLQLQSDTNFEAGLQQAVSFFSGRPEGQNLVFFLSDGANNTGGSFSDEVNTLLSPSGIAATIQSFGVGASASSSQLDLVDDGQANGSAQIILDPADLASVLIDPGIAQADVDHVDILVNGVVALTIAGANLDTTPLGLRFNFSGVLNGLSPSTDDTVVARVVATDPANTTVQTLQVVEQESVTPGNDRLTGGDGDDLIDGGGGNDILSGGTGNDDIRGGNGTDILLGDAGSDRLSGGNGSDSLYGGEGADQMLGGSGNDIYSVDNIGDQITEQAGQGNDTVLASVSYALAENVENLKLTGTANLNGTGNGLNNVIGGNDGNNTLNGGAGADQMAGYGGNDIYVVDNVGDLVFEQAGQGNDSVLAAFSYALGANVEALKLAGIANINGTGNVLNNVIGGNGGNNTLNGGVGADQMAGYGGNDIYFVDNAGDQVTEQAGQGNDTVLASVSYTLAANIESLKLTGTANLNGTGNGLNNVIGGNDGNNTLNGGVGADQMAGYGGNDIYVVDNVGDQVTEQPGQGNDTVLTSISHMLEANIESLKLTGTANLNGTGNGLNNVIGGNDGNNTLNGGVGNDQISGYNGSDSIGGGAGTDLLTGGAGNDFFYFDSALNAATNVDTITDFWAPQDTIRLENAIFTALTTTGQLAAAAFHVGAAAATPAQHILYNNANGWLSYDADGSGGGAAVHFATLIAHPTITNADFVVV